MSREPDLASPVPELTARIARAASPNGNPYLRLRDELGQVSCDGDFADLNPRRGQPALPPWKLALVTVMQSAEDLSDRQVTDAVRGRIDWRYAPGLERDDPGFTPPLLGVPRPPGAGGRRSSWTEGHAGDRAAAVYRGVRSGSRPAGRPDLLRLLPWTGAFGHESNTMLQETRREAPTARSRPIWEIPANSKVPSREGELWKRHSGADGRISSVVRTGR